MTDYLKDMEDFVIKYDLRKLSSKRGYKKSMLARIAHMREELDELEEALRVRDDVKIIDAIIDVSYLALGTGVLFDYDFEKHWDAVHLANMNKVLVVDEKSHKFGVKKPEGWVGPEETHRKILQGGDPE